MQTDSQTLILGGTGKTGSRVASRLRQQGWPIRIGSRTAERPFDWENQQTWGPALHGIDSVYITYYPDLAFPGASDDVRAFVNLALDHRVRRIVLLSGRGEEGAILAEDAVRNSGAEWTIVRASFFSQNFSEGFLADPLRSGEMAFPALIVKEPFIDIEDIAEIVAAALTTSKHLGQLYEVTGPRLLTFAEAAAEISKATGREIRYVAVSPEEYSAAMISEGVPPAFAANLTELFSTVLDGRNAYVTEGVRNALGRPPRDFADYARDAAASGVWGSK